MTTKKKRRMTDEYMEYLAEAIERKMQAYELYRRPRDKMMLECMVRDWEAKMKLKLQDEEIQNSIPPGPW